MSIFINSAPDCRFRIDSQGTVTPLNTESARRYHREGLSTMTELADIAKKLGMRVSAAPKPKPAQKTEPVKSKAMRPDDIAEMIGQDQVRVQMMLEAQAAMTEREEWVSSEGKSGSEHAMPPHTLLSGPRGTGKTTLAKITASLIGGQLIETTASAVTDVKVLGRKLASLDHDDVLFIDEIHGLSQSAQELLYTAMEDGVIHIKAGEGADVKTVVRQLNRFVLVGATTIQGKLEGPMIDRFGLVGKLVYYSDAELLQIITKAAEKRRTKIDEDAATALAIRSKGTPRIALSLLSKCRSYVIGMNRSSDIPVTRADVDSALELHGVDKLGLESDERAVLRALCAEANAGRPMGIKNIAAVTGMEEVSVEQIEPLLLRLELMVRTSRGRKATKEGYEHMGMKPPVDAGVDI
jgi:Holliday junction DNA helicase RuvB